MPYKDPEKAKEYYKKYNEENRKRINDRQRQYNSTHPDEIKIRNQNYSSTNRELIIIQKKIYNKRTYDERRQKAIDILGGKCSNCGAIDALEFDHVDPKTKSFNISTRIYHPWEKILPELAKCQLLCHQCHANKTALSNTGLEGRTT